MKNPNKLGRLTQSELKTAMTHESEQFERYYLWLEKHMTAHFFDEVTHEQLMLIAHNLTAFHLNEFLTTIHLKNCSIVLCLNEPDADVKILKDFSVYGIKNYQTFISDEPPPFKEAKKKLRIALIYYTEFKDSEVEFSENKQLEFFKIAKEFSPDLSKDQFNDLMQGMNARFLRSMTSERLKIALEMFFRARTRDHCQYEIHYNKKWKTTAKNAPSIQIVLAWRNTPKYRFLYRLAKVIHRHGLTMRKVNITYVDPYSKNPILLMSLGLHGINGKAAWDECDIPDFLQELVTLKHFTDLDSIESVFVDTGLIRGNLANLLRCMVTFVHQALVSFDSNLYSAQNIEEAFCRHPEITVELLNSFEEKFRPDSANLKQYEKSRDVVSKFIENLDTGHESNDTRRKNIFKQGKNFIQHTLKTNFYRKNKGAFSFRIDPKYLDYLPYDRFEKFPELPYGIFFIQGMHFIGFQIRFKDLSRGGLRTVVPKKIEQLLVERNNIFSECYNLAYTQQKKNKDIPEGGSKAVILLEPYERIHYESDIYIKELKAAGFKSNKIDDIISAYNRDQKTEYLYQAQRAFIYSMMTLINYDEENQRLQAKDIIDYYKKPEYIYLGPDENMHNQMIEWIADYSVHCGYSVGSCFISSKPSSGVNHKEYGVTSLGVNVYMQEVLNYLEIDPKVDPFTIKMTGGPDGDVAGNQILNLYTHFRKTAKLLALIDGSGTIFDPNGLDLGVLVKLFQEGKPISFYPPKKLSNGGFLLDTSKKKQTSSYATRTLCYKKEGSSLKEEWLSGSDMNHLLRHNVHQTISDIFIPAGGRPRTLNETNYQDFLDEKGKPTSRAIVEGANLYITPKARRELEKLGVLIIKDSSANKGGVICSSFEVLCGLSMNEANFIKHKPELMKEILEIIKRRARDEAQLLLKSHALTGAFLTDISDWVSEKINNFAYELLDYLETVELANSRKDPLIRCLYNYCPELIKSKFFKNILENVPKPHKKAIIACYIASKLVYKRGLEWSPSIVDILPLVSEDINIKDPGIDDDLDFEIE